MSAMPRLDVASVRADFPILQQEVHGHPLIYLDNAATTQKPTAVLDALRRYYEEDNANVHRGVHLLSERATQHYEQARADVANFVGAEGPKCVVFTRGTTEALNLAAHGLGQGLKPGDEVLITHLEHHSNIVPWQMACARIGAKLKVAPIDEDGAVDMQAFSDLVGPRTKVAAFSHVSNALGTINPVRDMTRIAKEAGARVVIDGAQAVPHAAVDVQAIGCDLYAFSGHKMYAPTGIGALVGTREMLERLPVYQGGGDMIASVTFEKTTYNDVPYRFEAGTPDIAGAIGLGAAVNYLQKLGMEAIFHHEHELLRHGTRLLSGMKSVRLIGTAASKAAVLSFEVEGVHPHDVGSLLDHEGIAVRTGHHCAQPVMDRFGVPATTRASFGIYNTKEELDVLAAALERVVEVFA
jgi:cysteine desulfurase / selenocysteine lyase